MRVKLYIVVSALFFAYTNNFAQNSQYQFSRLNISNGLSHNQVTCIFKDSEGFMWFGTSSGLNRYDGYTFKVFKHDVNNKNSINEDYINNIWEGPDKKLWITTPAGYSFYDPETEQFNNDVSSVLYSLKLPVYPSVSKIVHNGKGDFWFLYPDSGIYRYNELNKTTTHYYHHHSPSPSLYSSLVTDIVQDTTGNVWLAYDDGVIELFDVKRNVITYHTDIFKKAADNKGRNYSLTIDSEGDLWVFNPNMDSGVYYYSRRTGRFRYITKESAETPLTSNNITNIIQADDGLMWISTDHGGINLLDKKRGDITYLLNREDDPKSLGQNTVALYKDNKGIMWARTLREGVSYYHKNIIRFPLYRHFASAPASLKFEDVNKFVEDKNGNLWIGTNGGGLVYFDRKTGKFTQYKHDPGNPNSLTSDIIVSLCIDHDQQLWIGTYFGGLDHFDGRKFIHYKHNGKVPTSIADDRVWNILEDSSNRLWIGTFAAGLQMFDRDKKIFSSPFKQRDIRSLYISALIEDTKGNLWVGGYLGVDKILKNGRDVIHYNKKKNDPNSLINDDIHNITQDSRGLMWIATRNGLNILNPETGRFISLTKKDGLPDNQVLNVLEDNSGAMWLSTSNGLGRITLTPGNGTYKFQFESFDETDGLQGREFTVNAALKTNKGELVFGGSHGFNIFDPLSIHLNIDEPKLIFTGFQLFNKSIAANEEVDGHVVLSKAISATQEITLKHSENVFTIEFSALNFFNPNKITHQYMMEGFDKGWLTANNATRKATYTNLDGGDYTFKVRAIGREGKWKPSYIKLKIKVLPPFWKSPIAYFIYVFSIIAVLYYIRKQGIKKIETRFEIERVRKEAQDKHELDIMKIDFFTNVSHEFRTPIALIMAPVEKLLKQADDNYSRRKLQLIHENSKRLLNMINQLLDFSKMAVKKLQLDLREADIIKVIKEASDLFTDLADKKHISFSFKCDTDSGFTFFDQDKIERILFNLLSNAFKFTPDFGSVAVEAKLLGSNSVEMTLLQIKVIDSGVGIPAEKHNKIFERFFQNEMPASLINQGSGIGLSITKEFVDLMGGTISVESEHGKGSCFIVRLPLKISQKSNFTGIENTPEEVGAPKPDRSSQEKRNKNITILIVEDNSDFRAYLKDDLRHIYTIAEAVNGKDGWQKALALHPDLIISDINMAEIDGIDFCKKIRSDKRTEHIPFILITAFTGDEKQLAGLETGANDYLSKPFNFDILRFKVHNLLKNQQLVKETYRRQIEAKPGDLEIETPDTKFMRKLLTVIEENIPNAGFSVELLSSKMNMSRATLYNKVFNLSGKTPVEFIRSVRLKRAVQLLLTKQFTIAETAYEVGFNDAKYFSKVFKEEFLMTPSEYLDSTD
ncbi:signal transduction histidine kinase/ligand-binding sensor domain-containing protein/DNA-binding response OmpR family regulator [Mucilaginibacter sp. SG538B]|uniref:hybrid sensor histidine kinase/response regulator n=1 Tax=Mucilaginibacter sp. SG538B TaxID=2587021 RepID=UPI00159E9CE8|nr:hybrid sensor histidine kinase/response regulator transcription factor [Mucilaginibacter sp. SG538B]NVM67787.1 signal transduction histidine kinase/ligand-binding sensor domain-containing protein/DNA-binding response OmpR family regulator [Mucilaginibacter sp. SG538B]